MVTSTTPRGRGRPGRRPGNPDTRAQIVDAARQVFGVDGYDAASSRSIAREAGVDPALIHHYFESKAELFMAALQLPVDPKVVRESLDERLPIGEQLALMFLKMWDADGPSHDAKPTHPFITVVQAATSGPNAGAALRGFLEERVWSERPRAEGESDDLANLRHALVSSQLFGLAWARHVLQVEPLASAPIEAIAAVAGPTLERYITGDLSAFAASIGDPAPN